MFSKSLYYRRWLYYVFSSRFSFNFAVFSQEKQEINFETNINYFFRIFLLFFTHSFMMSNQQIDIITIDNEKSNVFILFHDVWSTTTLFIENVVNSFCHSIFNIRKFSLFDLLFLFTNFLCWIFDLLNRANFYMWSNCFRRFNESSNEFHLK